MAEVIYELKASDGHYTSIQTWWDTECDDYDFVTNTTSKVLECYNDWPGGKAETVDMTSITGYAASATYYPELRVAAGAEHGGIPDGGFRINSADWGAKGINVAAEYAHVTGIEVYMSNAQTFGFQTGTSGVVFDSCIASKASNGGFHLPMYFGTGGTPPLCRNCLALDSGVAPSDIGGFGGGTWRKFTLENCVAINCAAQGVYAVYGGPYVVKNTVAFGCATSFKGSTYDAASTNNASDDSDAALIPGDNSVINVTDSDFVNAAGNNFHLTAGSSLIGAGSGGTDIGAFQYVGGGGSTTYTKTASLDALVQKQDVLKTASLDSYIQKAFSIQASLDALASKEFQETASLDAVLQQLKTITSNIDSILITSGVFVDANLDSLLQKSFSLTAQVNALLQKGVSITTSLDSVLATRGSITASLDSILIGITGVTATLDALIQGTLTKQASLDAIIAGATWTDVTDTTTTWTIQ